MSYAIALERLRALAPKRLAHTYYVLDGWRDVPDTWCALAAVAPALRDVDDALADRVIDALPGAQGLLDGSGLTLQEARRLQQHNDTRAEASARRRYDAVLAWLELQVRIERQHDEAAKEPTR